MVKYKHNEETRIVLDDLENRIQQFIEANELYRGNGSDVAMIEAQNTAFGSVLVLIAQVRNTGHVRRGTPVVPDDLEPIVKTKWFGRPQLGLSEQMSMMQGEGDDN